MTCVSGLGAVAAFLSLSLPRIKMLTRPAGARLEAAACCTSAAKRCWVSCAWLGPGVTMTMRGVGVGSGVAAAGGS